jgi:ATP-dependent exoDNAse (exonuclease V) beta subunit
MTNRPFKVIRASAGSGKTYALVRQFLILALQSDYPAHYRHILAITFTNAAAAEMKERVMLRLREFARGMDSPLANEVAEELKISREKLGLRAANAYKDMLHHYSYLSILTIDSFTHKIIRSFARDLRLHHDFNIEVDATKFLEKLADQCLEKVGEDEELTQYLQDFLIDNIEDGKRLRLHDELVEAAKIILNEDTTKSLEKLGQLKLEDYRLIRKKIISENRKFSDQAIAIAKKALNFLDDHNLSATDFAHGGGGIISVLIKATQNEMTPPGPRYLSWPESKNKAHGKASRATKKLIEEHASTISKLMMEYAALVDEKNLQKFSLNKAILRNLHTTGLIENLHEIGSQLREDENVLLISDFHKKVNEIVRDNHAPFIYERIGVRYKHILIDEFQDTSLLQWSNMLPLLEESLSQKFTNLIVGDAKQSIYRWRGGNVEQFIDLPDIPEDAGRPDAVQLFRENIDIIQLQENRRSKANIVDFNNRLFSHISEKLGKYKSVYADTSQIATRGAGGMVKFEIIEEKDRTARRSMTLDSILEKVRECIASGFQPGDIAILVRRGEKDGSPIAEMLVSQGYKVVTRESFLVQNSPVVRVIMGYLGYKSDPSQLFYGVEMVQALSQIRQESLLEIFSSRYMVGEKRTTQIRLNDFFKDCVELDLNTINGNPYNQAISLMRRMGLMLDTATEYLLEKIRFYCIHKQWSLHDFIVWWQDSREKLFTASTTDNSSIQIMTVHKSKGLQFPVVIYPRFASKTPPKDLWINTETNDSGLPCAYVKYKKPKEDQLTLPEFEAEFEKDMLDETNVAYVAMTRAEERLYVIQEVGEQKETFSEALIQSVSFGYSHLNASGTISIGEESEYQSLITTTASESIELSSEESVITNLRVMPTRIKKDKLREYGELIHECLACMTDIASIKTAIQTVSEKNGIQSAELKTQLEIELNSILSNERMASWFSDAKQVYNEAEIILSGGQVVRPDRVSVRDGEIIVIDYKTGEAAESHKHQVRKYIEALSTMYTQPVKGFLFYTKSLACAGVEAS